MLFIEKIKEDQVDARKKRNLVKAVLLTTLLGEANMVAKNDQRENPTDDEVTVVVGKFLKDNKRTQEAIHEAISMEESHNPAYVSGNLVDKLNVAQEEQKILESYLPQQLSESEIIQIVSAAIAGGTAMNVGALMGVLKANHAGKYDGKIASAAIKTVLG